MSKFNDALNIVHKANQGFYSPENANCTSMIEAVNAELAFTEGLISDFFSIDHEGNNVKLLMEKVKDDAYTESVVDFVDTDITKTKFSEYRSGIETFVSDAKADSLMTESENDVKHINDKLLEKASASNKVFFENYFDGKENASKQVPLKDGMVVLERMIDFKDEIGVLRESVTNVAIQIESGSDDSTLTEAVRILTEAVSEYSYKTMSCLLDTYEGIRHEIMDEKEVKTFKMF